jgi:hypothetical protein
MEENTQVETEEVVPTATPEETPVPSQEPDPVQEELDRIDTAKRTKKEKLLFTKQRIEKQLAEFGDEPESIDDDRPLTLKDLRAIQASEAQQTAMTLAEEIEDANEQRLVKHYLETTIRPSGDAQTDLRNARLMANAIKNRQLAEESGRAARARTAPSAPAAPPRQVGAEPEFSKEEAQIMKGFGLTKEEAAKALQV